MSTEPNESLFETGNDVLVVEDDKDIRLLLERNLRRLGYQVRVAADGEEGLKMAVESPPKVVLTDIRMPGMDGHTLLRRLATHHVDSAVVVMSAHGTMEDVIDVLRSGAVDYLKKPWTPSELISAIAHAIEVFEKRRRDRQLELAATGKAPKTDSQTEETASDFHSLLEDLRRGVLTLPSPARVIADLRTMLASPDSAVDDVVDKVRQDQHVAAKLLRISNTGEFGRLGRNSDLRAAVMRVGLKRLSNVVETIAAHEGYPLRSPLLRALQEEVWEYSAARALAMRALAALAPHSSEVEPERAYTAGLMADLGATLLLWMLSEHPPAGLPSPLTEASCLDVLSAHHQSVGSAIMTWQGVELSVAAVAGSHHADSPPAPSNPYWTLAVVATDITDRLATDITRRGKLPAVLVDRCRADMGTGESATARVFTQLKPDFAALVEALG
jgi:DNA-binding response OmpR family regulator